MVEVDTEIDYAHRIPGVTVCVKVGTMKEQILALAQKTVIVIPVTDRGLEIVATIAHLLGVEVMAVVVAIRVAATRSRQSILCKIDFQIRRQSRIPTASS
jgi:hypothetical protein